ncbi:hypothetical protein OGAPHI_000744 [Ogataea philodendri]|uniref:Uncharacterized protein n=1 Tax=Ogataea philodendri TaxID=1378263 RepID=A0A9P8PEZ6_9ASCO|nr:uncharacterized protein OGAPHI_000744 [Ogataea philodendri]KAH3671033.1 hypothetical protein OGAPHI_000744 [Ogataea philodendri]
MFASGKNYPQPSFAGVLPQYHQRHVSYQPHSQPYVLNSSVPQQQYHHQHSMSYSGGYNMAGYYVPQAEFYPSQQQYQAAPPPVQEQSSSAPTGGVSSVLDYDLDQMVKFVCWLCFGLLKRTDSPSTSFHSTVKSVLSATRLPRSTIVLALLYLSEKMESEETPISVDSEAFENLTISLVLANKFNDDNTFRNKSWSDATGLSLELINKLERDWLCSIKWRLHYEDGYSCIEECWKTWCDKFKTKPVHSPYNDPFMSPSMDTPSGFQNGTPYEYRSPSSSLFSATSQYSPASSTLNSSPYYNDYQQSVQQQVFENPYQLQYNNSLVNPPMAVNSDYFSFQPQHTARSTYKHTGMSVAAAQRYYPLSYHQQQMVPPMMTTGVCYGVSSQQPLTQRQQQSQAQEFYNPTSYCAATAC